MTDSTPTQWRNVPGNPYLCPIDARMLLPEGFVKRRLFRHQERFTAYDRSYVVAKLTHELKALRGLNPAIWRGIINDVEKELGINDPG